MRKGSDISLQLPGFYLVHQNIPGKIARAVKFDEHLLFLPLQGEISIETDAKTYALGPGRMLYLPPGG